MSFLQHWKKPSSVLTVNDNPFYSLQTDINKLFGSMLSDWSDVSSNRKFQWNPQVELKETAKDFILTADLPGCKKEDVEISLNNNILSIKGERKFEETKNEDKCHISEKFYGSFERHIHMPENLVDAEKVKAKFDDGVLSVTLAKRHETKNSSKRIEIN